MLSFGCRKVRSPFAMHLVCLFACGLCFCAAAPVQSAGEQSAGDLTSLRRIWAVAEAGDNARALQQAREFVQTSPLSVEGLDLAGVLATRQGFLEEAGEYLWRALRIHPDSARLRSNLGYVYVRKGSPSEAILHFRASLWLEPSFPDAWEGLAAAFALLGDKQAQEVARGLPAPSDKSGSACARMADLLKRGAFPTTRLVTAFEGGPCEMDGPSLFLAELPAVLKFDRATLLMLQFREGSSGAWIFWSLPDGLSSGSARLDSTLQLTIPLPSLPRDGALYVTASRDLRLADYSVR